MIFNYKEVYIVSQYKLFLSESELKENKAYKKYSNQKTVDDDIKELRRKFGHKYFAIKNGKSAAQIIN